MTVGSLFAGIGGFDLGFERAGFKTIWQVELSPWCRLVLEKNFPEAKRFADIRECTRRELEPVDVIVGGFPCQDVSTAGSKRGITEGTRSGLWFEYRRIISELRPKYVVVENVAALLHRGMGTVLGDLADVGYDAEWHCLSASAFGGYHNRQRIFIVAYPAASRRTCVLQGEPGIRIEEEPRPEADALDSRCALLRELEQRLGEPALLGEIDGVPLQVEQLGGYGNAVVPQIATWIGQRILEASKVPPEAPNCSEVTSVAASRKSNEEDD